MLAFSLTYLVHSTLLIAAVWLLSRRLADRPLALDRLWKLALIGGVVTASVQTAAGLSPAALQLGGDSSRPAVATAPAEAPMPVIRWHFDAPKAPKAAAPEADVNRRPRTGDREPGTVNDRAAAESAPATASGSVLSPARNPQPPTPPAAAPASESGSASPGELGTEAWKWVLLLAGVVSLLLAFRLGVSWFRLRRILSDRRLVTGGPAPLILAQLEGCAGLRRRVKLSSTTRLEVPIAIGIIRPEICVPRRALEELDPGELETMLAHELAHLVRRDPAWRLLAGLVCRVFFFQPLNRIVAARLETASEMLCDDWAVEHTDEPLALARCLTEVAGWIASPPLDGSPVPAMARGGSGLGRRVRRLLAAGDGVGGGGMRRERWFIPLGAGLVALLIFAAPGATDTAPRAVRPVPPVPPTPPTPMAAPVPPAVRHHPVRGDLRRLLTQLRSGQKQDQDLGDWIALAQALGSPDNAQNMAQIFRGGLDLDLDVDIDVDVNPDGSIDIHVRPNGTPPPDPDADDGDDDDPNFFDFDLDFDADVDADADDDDADDDDDDDEEEDEDDDGDCSSGANIHIPDIHIPDIHIPDIHIPDIDIDGDQIREMKRQAREMARQAREQARQVRQQAREQARQARQHALEAARQARQQADQVREHVQREMERAQREMERAQREQHEALREQWRQMRQQQQQQHHHRFAVPPAPPVPPRAAVPPKPPKPPRAPAPPAPMDPFDRDSN
jgi:hypothetical protein